MGKIVTSLEGENGMALDIFGSNSGIYTISKSGLKAHKAKDLLTLYYALDPNTFKKTFMAQGVNVRSYDDVQKLIVLSNSGGDVSGAWKAWNTNKPIKFNTMLIANGMKINHFSNLKSHKNIQFVA